MTRAGRNPLTDWRLWLAPTVVVVLVMATLAGAYLGGSLNTNKNIRDFPIAIVDEDRGATLPDGTALEVGNQIESGLLAGIDADQFAVQLLTLDEAQAQMDGGDLYGAIVLPATLSSDVVAWATGAITPAPAERPTVTVLTNPRIGAAATSITTNVGSAALAAANAELGTQVSALVTSLQQSMPGAQLSGVAATSLQEPLLVQVTAHNPLPDGTGGGLSAFYYALLLVLAGFTGSIVANTLIDTRLGFLPTEIGPLYRLKRSAGVSRRATLVAKWGVAVLVAITVSATYLGIATWLGMPVEDPWALWAFGVAMIVAVSAVVQTINALAGNAGMLINMIVFIILGLPSAGGTLPLEAVPPFFRWLGTIEPLHQVYLGARDLLYLDGSWDAGLGRAMVFAGISIVVAVVVGLVGTTAYDRSRHERGHRLVVEADAA